MAVSDATYGSAERYVSRPRLQAMLDHEFNLNLERLSAIRGDSTSFFAFADTVAIRNYKGTNECHGWLGVKFQSHPRDAPSQVIVHVRMPDRRTGPEFLAIFSRDVLKRIGKHDPTRETMVPAEVCELIKKRGFFGCNSATPARR